MTIRVSRWVGVFLILCTTTVADVRLPNIFGDHMVLQREKPITVWGWAEPGESVTVSLGGATQSITAGTDSTWSVTLPAMLPGDPHTLVVEGSKRIEFRDILIGDVWLCSGQSNMEWRILHSNDGAAEIAKANHPNIRVLTVANRAAITPRSDFDAAWTVCRPRAAIDYSAVAYYFARELQQELDVPIGLIHSSWGGSAVEPWISGQSKAAQKSKAFQHWEKTWAEDYKTYGAEIETYYAAMGDWLEDAYFAMVQAQSVEPYAQPPKTATSLGVFPSAPQLTYNAMVAPLKKLPLSGVIWYQGESNASRAWEYRDLFSTLIQDWREVLDQPDLPFLFVQLANYMKRDESPVESAWAELREAQALALRLPQTGMAVIIDIGEAGNIHPGNKQDVGKRLALAAKKIVYGLEVEHSGPVLRKMKIRTSEITLTFDHAEGGLTTWDNASLTGFAIAGRDRVWKWANAKIDGETVKVWHDDIKKPAAVRYGWANNPDCNLYNQAGLPASPFRTDNWPVSTQPED